MVIMVYFMFFMGPPVSMDDGHDMANKSHPGQKTHVHYNQIMILPGLDVLNLLMFLFATPVQVGLRLSKFSHN